jgi:hypothetical protein
VGTKGELSISLNILKPGESQMSEVEQETSILKLNTDEVRAIDRLGSHSRKTREIMDVMVLKKINPMSEFEYSAGDFGPDKPTTPTDVHPCVSNALFLSTT